MVTLKGEETHAFGDESQSFIILEMRRGGRTMLPATSVEQSDIRALVSARKARKLIKDMKSVPEKINDKESWKERAQRLTELLKDGIPENYIAVLQELLYRATIDKISTTENRVLEQARSYFLTEFNEVLNMPTEKLGKELENAFAHLKPEEEKAAPDKSTKAKKTATKKS